MFDYLLISKTLFVLTLAIISPGPDFFMVLRNSLSYGRSAGFYSALGIAVGCIISFSLLMSSLHVLFQFQFIQLLLSISCGTYLIYLGINSFRTHSKNSQELNFQARTHLPFYTYFRNGLLTNILNPKLYAFSGAILTYTLQNNTSDLTDVAVIFGNAIIAFAWFSIVAILLTHAQARAWYTARENLINKILGIGIIFLGIKILLHFFHL